MTIEGCGFDVEQPYVAGLRVYRLRAALRVHAASRYDLFNW